MPLLVVRALKLPGDLLTLERQGPVLPEGHAERVKSMHSIRLSVANATSDDCSICLDSMPAGAVVTDLSACKHRFHLACIQEWLGRSNACPLCKRTAIAPPGEAAASAVSV